MRQFQDKPKGHTEAKGQRKREYGEWFHAMRILHKFKNYRCQSGRLDFAMQGICVSRTISLHLHFHMNLYNGSVQDQIHVPAGITPFFGTTTMPSRM